MLSARIARREGDLEGEEHALLQALDEANDGTLRGAVELALAKHYEHRRKDLQRALAHAAGTAPVEGEDGSRRRVARLMRRLARAG